MEEFSCSKCGDHEIRVGVVFDFKVGPTATSIGAWFEETVASNSWEFHCANMACQQRLEPGNDFPESWLSSLDELLTLAEDRLKLKTEEGL